MSEIQETHYKEFKMNLRNDGQIINLDDAAQALLKTHLDLCKKDQDYIFTIGDRVDRMQKGMAIQSIHYICSKMLSDYTSLKNFTDYRFPGILPAYLEVDPIVCQGGDFVSLFTSNNIDLLIHRHKEKLTAQICSIPEMHPEIRKNIIDESAFSYGIVKAKNLGFLPEKELNVFNNERVTILH